MGLFTTLGLRQPKVWPPAKVTKAGSAPAAKPKAAPNGKPVGPVVEYTMPAGPLINEENMAVPQRTKTIAKIESASAEAAADTRPAPPAAAAAPPSGDASAAPPVSFEVGEGDLGAAFKTSEDGQSLVVKWEKKQYVAGQNFKVWVVPCFVNATVGIGVEGEINLGDGNKRSLKIKGFGGGALGVGYTSKEFTAGPRGAFQLSASTSIPVTMNQARKFAADPFVVEIKGEGKVGIMIEIENGPSRALDVDVVDWQLYLVHVGACVDSRFGSVRVEDGKDMQRFKAALMNLGPTIADAVDKYAPEFAKKAAVDGAKWVAESPTAGKIADGTGAVLDTVKEETGVDIGGGAEKVVQVLVDPGGETSEEANKRFTKEAEEANAAHADFRAAMEASGLDGELRSRTDAEMAEYNAIVEAKRTGGDWKSMIPPLVAKRKTRRFEQARAEAARKKKDKDDGDAAAAAELARRVAQAEARMNAAEQATIGPGNHLNNNFPAGSKARQYWQQGMKFRDPGTLKKMEVRSLLGEARIAKAEEATGLFLKAKTVFEQGAHVRD